MGNYLTLNFQNAKLFRKFNKETKINRRCSDFVSDGHNDYKRRDLLPSFIEPITVHQISNMLHVLFNERPVPSLRKVFYERNEHYFEMAQNSYLKIDTPKIYKDDYHFETIHVKKSVHNAWNPSTLVNWEIIRLYTDSEDKFNRFTSKLDEIFKSNMKLIPFMKIREMVINLDKETRLDLYETIKELEGCDGLIYFFGRYTKDKFDKPQDSGVTTKKNKTGRMVNTGIETVARLSGQIIVPVSDDDIQRLRTISKGFATILDGGIVTIESIKSGNSISVNDFICVKDISDAMTTPFINK